MRIGLVGPGNMGSHHARCWLRLGHEVEVHTPIEEDLAEAGEKLQVPTHKSLEALLGRADVVDVCTPTDVHREVVEAAARAKKPVICEKPLGRTVADAEAMVAACREAGVPLHCAQVVRFFPQYGAARAAIEGGRIGRPAVLRLSRQGQRPTQRSWYLDERRSGGVLLDLMIHDLDFARWIGGHVERVFARIRASDDGVPTRAFVILTHASGAISHVQATWGPVGTPFGTTFEFAGDGGLLSYDGFATEPLQVRLTEQEVTTGYLPRISPLEDPYAMELAEFAAAIGGGPQPRVTAEDGVEAVRLAMAAMESNRSGRTVRPQEVTA
ncbi:MAG TPA: Gfo/Idh/MocA family oxidoreductase [Candidatus Dormibacteraeota bacterium]|jgi:myo-inositol 2-dehydrogenase/D-chiro-inositol 1-dehydrogenase|nr:Gfo/Idh/MocA family oxidoreductase [Candidatus Dormibacteraeota bacterium]